MSNQMLFGFAVGSKGPGDSRGKSRNPLVARACLYCGKIMQGARWKIERKKYCSYKCVGKAHEKNTVKTCPTCLKVFVPAKRHRRQIYCSHQCCQRYEATIVRRTGQKKCPQCKRVQPIEKFRINIHTSTGRDLYCIECRIIKSKDIVTKLNRIIASGVYRLIKESAKRKGWSKDRPYTIQELQNDIEAKMLPGMSWENYGKEWHVDHKVPLSKFHLTSVCEPLFWVALGLKNLQPMWRCENASKSDKIVIVDKGVVEVAREIIAISTDESPDESVAEGRSA